MSAQICKTFAKLIAPSSMPALVLWGDEKVVRERLALGFRTAKQ
jgi:hypothetical protein